MCQDDRINLREAHCGNEVSENRYHRVKDARYQKQIDDRSELIKTCQRQSSVDKSKCTVNKSQPMYRLNSPHR